MPSQGVTAHGYSCITGPLPLALGNSTQNWVHRDNCRLRAQREPMCCPWPEDSHKVGW